jgi:acyl carrier protein
MNTSREQVAALVYRAVDEINQELTDGQQLTKDPATVLFGKHATIDSMALVSFIVAVEEQLLQEFGVSVTLANDKAMSMERSPFRTLATLVEYVEGVMAAA